MDGATLFGGGGAIYHQRTYPCHCSVCSMNSASGHWGFYSRRRPWCLEIKRHMSRTHW